MHTIHAIWIIRSTLLVRGTNLTRQILMDTRLVVCFEPWVATYDVSPWMVHSWLYVWKINLQSMISETNLIIACRMIYNDERGNWSALRKRWSGGLASDLCWGSVQIGEKIEMGWRWVADWPRGDETDVPLMWMGFWDQGMIHRCGGGQERERQGKSLSHLIHRCEKTELSFVDVHIPILMTVTR